MASNRTILGADCAKTATGLVLIRCDKPKTAVWWTTIKPLTIPKLKTAVHEVCEIIGLDRLELLVTEGAFFSKGSPEACASVSEAGGMIKGMIGYLMPELEMITLKAVRWKPKETGWREMVLRSNPKDKDACVLECTMLAREAGIENPTEHEAEAYGIALAGAKILYERELAK